MRKNYYILIILISILISVLLFSKYFSKKDKIILNEEEILDYQGEKLSSIEGFRENSIKGPQYIDINNYKLKITGLVENNKNYSYDEILNKFQKYEKVTTIYCVEGWSLKILWEGFLVRDLLNEAKVKDNGKILIFKAYDGYTTSIPINYFYDKDILIAYKINGVTLPPERGFPFQLVAENKWGYKWIKWITEIEVSDNVDYRGYWEERGFSNDGDLDKSFIENPK
jgi:DMSO/TMAO reductase YedYZ molybdopterin-dependent catalytic subunit